MRLSYSSSKTALLCLDKFHKEKVLNLPSDPDAEDDKEALRYGTAYHAILELTKHDHRNFTMEIFDRACWDNQLDADCKYRVYASLTSYYKMHALSKLIPHSSEIKIGIPEVYVGYIDEVMTDVNGWWWMIDLKTSGNIQPNMFPRLHKDQQLNLYAKFKNEVAEMLKLDPDKFAGCRYRVVGKSRAVVQAGESMKAFAARVKTASWDIEIPVEELDPEGAWEEYLKVKAIADTLTPESKPPKNREGCFNYSSPCPYWSHCHKGTYTECSQRLRSFNAETMLDRTIVKAPVPETIIDEMELLS